MKHFFLSASVPLPERHRKYFDTADVFLIREAIRALVEVVLPIGTITFGGHPAISPLISLFMRNSGVPLDRVTVFQSDFFPRSAERGGFDLANVRYTKSVVGERESSLELMRHEMIRSRKFDAAVLVGGMEGIDAELKIFRKIHPHALVLPVPSTGAAAGAVYRAGKYPEDIGTEISFASMYRRHLFPRP